MEYISIFIAPLFVISYLWITYGWRDAYRKAREKFIFMILITSVIMASMFFLARSSNEVWEVSNGFAWLALLGMITGIVAVLTVKHVKIKKYAKEFNVLEQETMYETGSTLEEAFKHRIIKYSGGKPSKMTTINIDLNVVDDKKDLLPHLKQEILDIVGDRNVMFYEYGLTKIDPSKVKISDCETSLSAFYKGVLREARKNLQYFDCDITFEQAMALNDNVVEYAVLYILEKAKELKNTPMGNLGSLIKSPQDEHMYGACSSLGFTSVGRYGIAIFVGYRLFHEKSNINQEGDNHE